MCVLFFSFRCERVERLDAIECRLRFDLLETGDPLVSLLFFLALDDHHPLQILDLNSIVRSRLSKALVQFESAIDQHGKTDDGRIRIEIDQI